jgi:PAS domain S-box-containing protein
MTDFDMHRPAWMDAEGDERARLALNACGVGVWSWDAQTGRITADTRYRELFGFGVDEQITATAWIERVHPDDREVLLARVAEGLKTGRLWREDFRVVAPDGVRIVEGYGRVHRDSAGSVLGLIGINLEVTARERASLALRQSEAELKAVVDGAIDAIIAIGPDALITRFNRAAAELFGYTESEILGQNVRVLMPEPDRSAHDGYMKRYMAGGEARIIGRGREVMGRRKDGSTFPLDLGISEVTQGSRHMFIGVIRDITERRKAEATQRLLMDELNHRVKNTLVTVQAMAEQTLRMASDPAQFVESFRGRLQALSGAHDLLTQTAWSGVALDRLVAEQLVMGGESIGQIRPSGPPVELKPQTAVHLGLVLHELGTNARKYGALTVPGAST